MELENLQVLRLHENPQYLKPCCELINDEWPRSETARMVTLQASCNHLPTSLILINDMKHLLGHCKLTPIPSLPESCFIETVVISKAMRGKKLGSYLMRQVEEYCKNVLKLSLLHLSTKGQENFYSKLGYEVCAPVSIYGTRSFNNESIEISSKIQNPVPVNINTLTGPPPPPPPPMPKPESLIHNNTLKSTKTFMSKAVRQIKAPEKKKASSQVATPRKRNPTVKQLESKLNTQAKKMDKMKQQLDAVKQLVKETKKPVQKKQQPKVERKIVIQDRYY